MGQDPETIRQQIAETRAQMEGTVDALGHKADVKGRAKESVQGKVDAATGRVAAVKEKLVGQGNDAAGTAGDLRDRAGDAAGTARDAIGDQADAAKGAARRGASVAQENPLGLALGAVAIGVIGGLLVPVTRIEEEKLGPVAQDLREQAEQAGHDAFEHGKEVVTEAAGAAKDAAQEAATAAA